MYLFVVLSSSRDVTFVPRWVVRCLLSVLVCVYECRFNAKYFMF